MDKQSFLQAAPDYYIYAIGYYIVDRGLVTENDVKTNFITNSRQRLLIHNDLFTNAIASMIDKQIVEAIDDDFGPTVYRSTKILEEHFSLLADEGRQPYHKRLKLKLNDEWLYAAISKVNTVYSDLGIEDKDLVNPDADWEPLPLERDAQELAAATKNLQETIQAVEQDNGYAATLPEERAYVLAGLKATAEKVAQGEISVGFLRRYTFDQLLTLVKRFKKAAIGVIASTTAAAFLALLKDTELQVAKEALKKIFNL